MAVLRIRKWGDPILKKVAEPILEITPEIRTLAQDMFETMAVEKGVGLAGNQIGVAKRIFVLEIPEENEASAKYVFINPEITWKSKKKVRGEEGCLSFPGIYAPVERPESVEISGLDLEGRNQKLRVEHLTARACQHELDHLDAIVFIDRMQMVQRLVLSKELKELAETTRKQLAGSQG